MSPIRTNRGRAAVYRKLWGWPMRSPGHLVVILVVVAVLVVAISLIVPRLVGPGGDSGRQQPGAAGGTSSTAPGDPSGGDTGAGVPGASGQRSATGELPTRITSPPRHPTSAAPTPAALDVITKWGRAWVHHPDGITNEEWVAGLQPYTDDEYLVEMSTVDPANVPATRVTGAPVPKESYTSSVTANLPTNGGTIAVTVIKGPDGWRVSFYEQVA